MRSKAPERNALQGIKNIWISSMSHIFSCQVSVISIKFWTCCDTVLSDILIYIYYISLSAQKVSRQMTLSHGIRSSELLACTLTDDKKASCTSVIEISADIDIYKAGWFLTI